MCLPRAGGKTYQQRVYEVVFVRRFKRPEEVTVLGMEGMRYVRAQTDSAGTRNASHFQPCLVFQGHGQSITAQKASSAGALAQQIHLHAGCHSGCMQCMSQTIRLKNARGSLVVRGSLIEAG